MRNLFFILLMISILTPISYAQLSTIEGYIFESNGTKPLKDVEVKIFNKKGNALITSMLTNNKGYFSTGIAVGKTYKIETAKDQFNTEKTKLVVKRKDKNKKVLVNIKMSKIPGAIVSTSQKDIDSNKLEDKTGQELPPNIYENVSVYGINTKKIDGQVNPKGITFDQEINNKNPYAEVTNATRLVESNYDDNADKEALKRQRIPTAYSPNVKIDPYQPNTSTSPNRDMPTSYNRPSANPIINRPKPQFGETMVASATYNARTQPIPPSFTGYKVEFVTATTELLASHDIFRRHGNIAMEQKQNGIYSYLIGNFADQKQAFAFLKEVILPTYPNANLVFFNNGKRVKIIDNNQAITKPITAPPR